MNNVNLDKFVALWTKLPHLEEVVLVFLASCALNQSSIKPEFYHQHHKKFI